VGLKEAVLCEPLACGKHALDLMNLDLRTNVVVSGSGIIGISAAIACAQAGAKNLIVSGVGKSKKEFIEELGARYVDITEEDLVEVVKDITDSAMADVAFECVGVEVSLHSVIRCTRPGQLSW